MSFIKCLFVLTVLFSLLGVSKAIMKRARKRREHHTINSLPNDLLMEVFVKVASASLPQPL
jgi:hypothetical protein